MKLIRATKRLLPTGVRRWLRLRFGWKWFRGSYANWEDAASASSGYDMELIKSRCLNAALAVRSGKGAFERDGVIFEELTREENLLDAFQRVQCSTGELRVIDFGGSFATTYWRHREALRKLNLISWSVVEQSGFVEAGRLSLADDFAQYYFSTDEARRSASANVILASNVLQYLPNPFEFLNSWAASDGFVILNNVPLHESEERIAVQYVPPSIYRASYPMRIFNRSSFMEKVRRHFDVLWEYESEAVWPVGNKYLQSRGMLLRTKSGR